MSKLELIAFLCLLMLFVGIPIALLLKKLDLVQKPVTSSDGESEVPTYLYYHL